MSLLSRLWTWFRPRDSSEGPGPSAADIQRLTGHVASNLDLFAQAMKHRSLLRGQPGAGVKSNERLEFLGDAILGFVTAERLYHLYPDEDEGFLTRLRSKLVNGKALAQRARELELGALIMVSDNLTQQSDGRLGNSIMADAFEALIGALYLDGGMAPARAFIDRTVLSSVDLDQLVRKEDNPKSLLLEFAQAKGWPQPTYQVTEESGPSHERLFTVEVLVRGEPHGTGSARSKKRAEQRAAAEAIEQLRSIEAAELNGDPTSPDGTSE